MYNYDGGGKTSTHRDEGDTVGSLLERTTCICHSWLETFLLL